MLRDIANTESRMLVNGAFLRNSFSLFFESEKEQGKTQEISQLKA
jgi:hypothetical protein